MEKTNRLTEAEKNFFVCVGLMIVAGVIMAIINKGLLGCIFIGIGIIFAIVGVCFIVKRKKEEDAKDRENEKNEL